MTEPSTPSPTPSSAPPGTLAARCSDRHHPDRRPRLLATGRETAASLSVTDRNRMIWSWYARRRFKGRPVDPSVRHLRRVFNGR